MDNILKDYKPDIISCISSLSNDEVFTSPELARNVLDLLPKELWSNPNVKFLDPTCKTGIFLREISSRLIEGLKEQIPDLQTRVNHILTKQVYGIGLTELTSHMARRSLYCSKFANGKYSICTEFKTKQGNIHYGQVEHSWDGGKCVHCGAPQKNYDRGKKRESYAYEFIHKQIKEVFGDMKFDVLVGNPPYQLSDSGGRGDGAIPIYNKFVEMAKKLDPTYITMIIPARWYSGGKGLDEFRNSMINDERIQVLHDFPETSLCFPTLNIRGGVCYFLWNKAHKGECEIYNHRKGLPDSITRRKLNEAHDEIFIRYNQSISILEKVRALKEPTMDRRVSSRKPFGINSNFDGFVERPDAKHNIALYRFGQTGYVSMDDVIKGKDLVDKIKVIDSKASPGGDSYPHQILTAPIIADKMSATTETYLIIDTVETRTEAENLVSYMHTQFFRFMVSLIKNTQNISKGVYALVPVQSYAEAWTDEKLYAKYGITQDEINFINSMIKPISSKEEPVEVEEESDE